jgi:hypothetical protein
MAVDYDNDLPPIEIDIDLYNRTGFPTAPIKQYDENARWIIVTLWDNGTEYIIPSGTIAQFAMTKPSGKGILNPCIIENNKIYYQITLQSTTESGNIDAEFRLGRSATDKIAYSTPKFKLNVEKSALQNDTILSTSEVNILNQLILDADSAIKNANIAAASVNTATTNAINATNSANTASTNASNAANNANSKATLANDAANLANSKATLANDAALFANNEANKAKSINTDISNAESIRVESETTRNENETIRQGFYSAYKVLEEYDDNKSYIVGNHVRKYGSTYQCISPTTANSGCSPIANSDNSWWICVAAKGTDGAGGDMFKNTYDTNNNGIVDNAEKINGYTVDSNVPTNAKFTDTITTINGKTGAISKNDITALGIPAQDTVYTHPSSHPASMITGLPTSLPANGGNSDTVDGFHVTLTTAIPSSLSTNVICLVYE